jgi:hypothetical protein
MSFGTVMGSMTAGGVTVGGGLGNEGWTVAAGVQPVTKMITIAVVVDIAGRILMLVTP